MQLLLIVNPSASSVTARARVIISRALSQDHRLKVVETSRRGHATKLAQGAAADAVDVVLVLGGDGTVNEAANGLAGSETALAVLPGGSTNVFARTVGLPNDPIAATDVVIRSLATGSIRKVSLGSINGRMFVFHVGVGFDAAVVSKVEEHSFFKRHLGAAVFLWATLSTWGGGFSRDRAPMRVQIDGAPAWPSFFAICLRTDPYTYVGSRALHIAPGADILGTLNLVSFRRLRLPSLLAMTAQALRRVPVDDLPRSVGEDIQRRYDVNEIVISCDRPMPFQVDGDYLGEEVEFRLRCEHDALRVVLPS